MNSINSESRLIKLCLVKLNSIDNKEYIKKKIFLKKVKECVLTLCCVIGSSSIK